MNRYVIIVAGGSGQRFGSKIPKQFVTLKGLPIIFHSIYTFYNFDNHLKFIITLPKEFYEYWDNLCEEYNFKVPHSKVVGGITRFMSVKNALDAINDKGLVAIHDAVRPLVSKETLERCFEAAKIHGNAIPVVTIVDSIRKLNFDNSIQVNRDEYVLVQTPQVFDIDQIKDAFKQPYQQDFTDDAVVLEKTGRRIIMVEGNRENIKITTQLDMIIAEAIMNAL